MRKALREWVGGRFSLPAYVLEGEPFRPDVVLWLELPSQLIVWTEILDPKKSTSFAATFQAATTRPHVGAPRRPDRVRIADQKLAAELRATHPDLAVAAAPTPEIDAVLAAMTSAMPTNDDESYLEDGTISTDSIARLFRAAEVLWKIAPWEDTDDSQVLRVDIPALGVEGACLSVMGALGESIGVLLFPSLAGFEAFLDAAEHPRPGTIDCGTNVLSLTFERGADLAPSLRREVHRHGWPVAGPDAYPYLAHRDRDGILRPLVERDLRSATVVATALAAFFARHGNVFAEEDGAPLCESWFDEDDLEVRLTLPYDAYSSFAITPPPRRSETAAPHVGRNDPCPCGTGKKFKKCCLRKEQAGPAGPQNVHELDRKLVIEMSRYADGRFGDAWDPGDDFVDPEAALEFAIPWSVYGYHIEGRPVVDWYLAKRARSLSSRERDWLEAQRHAWMGLWEVTAVEPGRSVTLRDHLSREERRVQEATASTTLVPGDTVLARVVDHGDTSVFCGLYPRSLRSIEAAEVVRRAQGRLRRRSAIPIERLRDEAFSRYLIARWEGAVDELEERHSIPPQLYNTDGEPLLVTVDHFIFDPARRADLLTRLASIDGIGDPQDDRRAHETCFGVSRAGNRMHEAWDSTLVGSIRVADGTVKVETNSVARADELRRRVEAACSDLLRHRAREHADLLAGF